jgi:sodium-dependent dicarboxylate transporter 2/3/5
MLPTTIASSLAFMLPVATPPNAIVFGTKRITLIQMAKAGLL